MDFAIIVPYLARNALACMGPSQVGDPSRNIPARPFLGISDQDETEILDIIKGHLAGLAK